MRDSWGISPVEGSETPKASTVYAVESGLLP